MPYALVVIGLIMIITGVLNTYAALASQLQTDFTGDHSFIFWVLALGSVGALGYINDLRQFSHYFMALILISMILANRGVFANFQAAIKSGPVAPTSQGTNTSAPTTGLFGSNPPSVNSNTVLNLGPLGTVEKPSITPGGWLDNIAKWWNPSAK